MYKISIIGDLHTVNAWRLAGVSGVVCDRAAAPAALEEIIRAGDAGIVVITQALAEDLQERIAALNLSGTSPVIIEVPGIDDPLVLRRSVVDYIAEALGISL